MRLRSRTKLFGSLAKPFIFAALFLALFVVSQEFFDLWAVMFGAIVSYVIADKVLDRILYLDEEDGRLYSHIFKKKEVADKPDAFSRFFVAILAGAFLGGLGSEFLLFSLTSEYKLPYLGQYVLLYTGGYGTIIALYLVWVDADRFFERVKRPLRMNPRRKIESAKG